METRRYLLDNKSLVLVVNHFGERSRDGVVGSSRLGNQSEIALQTRILVRLLDSPLADIAEHFAFSRSLLGGLAGSPAV